MILPGESPESIAASAQCIRAGRLLGLPTETVYGLAADADNDVAVAQIFQAKGRPADHPLIVHVASASVVQHYAQDVPDFAKALMEAFWPGPLTLILPRRPGVATAAAGGHHSIGLRCPAHPLAHAVLAALQQQDVWGLAAPSANQFGRVSPTTAAHVQGEFGPELLILDGGACQVGIESTIIDCTRGQPVLLRPGAITPSQIEAACGLAVLAKNDASGLAAPAPQAPGTLASHYAPRALVRLMTAPELQTAWRSGPASPVAVWHRCPLPANEPRGLHGDGLQGAGQHLTHPMPPHAEAAAHTLFAMLRAFDEQGVTEIWVESPPLDPAWDGVRDRLQRAATR